MGSLLAAVSLLTVIPVGRSDGAPATLEALRGAPWALPAVGLLIGVAAVAVDFGFSLIMSPSAASLLVVGMTVMVTGAMNLDGLADSADGLLVTAEPARRLEIMKDSHVGSFGVVAVVMVLLAKVLFLTQLSGSVRVVALLLAPCLARSAAVGVAAALGPARRDGMGRAMKPPVISSAVTLTAVLAICALLRPVGVALAAAVAVAAIALGGLAFRRIGGYTGDVLGAVIEIGEAAAFMVAGMTWFLS